MSQCSVCVCPLRANPRRCHCVTPPATRQSQLPREDRGGGKSGEHRGSHGLLRVVDLGRIDTDSVLMWQLSVQHGRRAAPLGMCFVYKQTAPRRPGKRSVPADCRLQAANYCHLVPARNYSGLRRVGHFTNLIVSNHSNL